MLTDDGGKTWKQHSFRISRDDISILNSDGFISGSYSEAGRITISLITWMAIAAAAPKSWYFNPPIMERHSKN